MAWNIFGKSAPGFGAFWDHFGCGFFPGSECLGVVFAVLHGIFGAAALPVEEWNRTWRQLLEATLLLYRFFFFDGTLSNLN